MTFNVEGFYRNNFYLSRLLNTICPKIVFLQEIWTPFSAEHAMSQMLPDYNLQISTPDMFCSPEDKLSQYDHIRHGATIL